MKIACASVLALVLACLQGCATQTVMRPVKSEEGRFSLDASYYIVRTKDGKTDDQEATGKRVAKIISEVLREQVYQVWNAETSQTYQEAWKYAAFKGIDYLVYPEIIRWKNGDHESDELEMSLKIFQVATGRILDHAVIRARGGNFTIHGDPGELLYRPLKKYLNDLFGFLWVK